MGLQRKQPTERKDAIQQALAGRPLVVKLSARGEIVLPVATEPEPEASAAEQPEQQPLPDDAE